MRPLRQLLLIALLLLPHTPTSAAPLDWSVVGGHFYTQTGRDGRGFIVSDADGVPFLSELRARGGPQGLGYPISHRFEWKGTLVQAFQKAVLQWLPGERRVAFLNIFDDLAAAGRDDWLRSVRSTPSQAWLPNEAGLPWEEVVDGRLAFLDANPAIAARYRSVDDPMSLFGLPASRVEDMGNHFAIRLQRAVIQQWKVDVPWARAGETTVANGGDIAKEAGVFPRAPLEPGGPDESTPVMPIGRGSAPSPPAASPAATDSQFNAPPMASVPPASGARRVVLDAGHGGAQIGAVARFSSGELREKDVNLDITLRAAALLRAAGYDVTLTRESDRQAAGPDLTLDLQTRIDIANAARAEAFVSIHNNGIANPGTRGTEVYYAANRPFSASSNRLASLVYEEVGRQLSANGYLPVGRGVKSDTAIDGRHFFLLSPRTVRVVRPSEMPAALLEALFLTNPDDAAQLMREEQRQAIARGVASAVGAFLTGRRG